MPRPTETALKTRARSLLETMTARGRWVYAVPRENGTAKVESLAATAGLVRVEETAGPVLRFANVAGTTKLAILDCEELEVMIVDASGSDAPALLSQIIEAQGFYAQSTLLGTAADVRDEESGAALRTLAHMVVAWDADWSTLFRQHLTASDVEIRKEAASALAVAVTAAGDAGPAPKLLADAAEREADTGAKEAIAAALAAITGQTTS